MGDNFLISCDGLTGVGKGTLCTNLASLLGLEVLDTGLLYRSMTYVYEDLKLELSDKNTDLVAKSFTPKVFEGKLRIEYKQKFLEMSDLKNLQIDSNLNKYINNLYLRAVVDEIMKTIMLDVVKKPFIADLRGAYPPYIQACEDSGLKVVRILLYTDLNTKIQRRFNDHIKIILKDNPEIENDTDKKAEIFKESKTAIIKRDEHDIDSIKKTNIGLIHKNSGIIDTTILGVNQVIETAIWHIASELEIDIS